MNLGKKIRTLVNKKNKKENNLLESHDVDVTNMFRLHYIEYEKGSKSIESYTDLIFNPFTMPCSMNSTEVFKVLSFLYDYSISCVRGKSLFNRAYTFNKILGLKNLKINKSNDVNSRNITDLFIVLGNKSMFKESKYYNKYFDWYIPSVSFYEVESIYKKYGLYLIDIFNNDLKLELVK